MPTKSDMSDRTAQMSSAVRRCAVWMLALIGALCLSACGLASSSSEQDFTIRSTVTATYGGKPVEGSAVVFQRLVWESRNYTRGEAPVIHLGNGKRAYLVMLDDTYGNLYIGAIQTAFNPYPRPCRGRWPEDAGERIRTTPVGTVLEYNFREKKRAINACDDLAPVAGLPLVIAFTDESDPTTAFKVDTDGPTQLFGKTFVFGDWTIERLPLDTPLTEEIVQYLPWADETHEYWRGRGLRLEEPQGRLASEAPITRKLDRLSFKAPA